MSTQEFAARVVTLAIWFRMSVTSWGRSTAHNKTVGGVANSYHLSWRAVDVVLDDPTEKAALKIAAAKLDLQLIDEQDHLHLEPV